MDIKQFKFLKVPTRKNGKKIKQAADKLAPLEEQTQGIIIVDDEDFKTANLIESSDEVSWRDLLRFEPVVIVILFITLAFIAFIAWQISAIPTVAK